ncbi:hypothetical protein HY493_02075 [Candidatus Woesearchaeota archaeon]|nr:hypothetical protein [Candidatus Woesearchaeota archaeon]
MIWTFIDRFTDEEFIREDDAYQLGDEWYLVPQQLFKLGKDLPRQPVFVGAFLGRKRNDYVVPGVALLDLLARSRKTKKVFVTDKAAWLFVCKKNVITASITKTENDPQPGDWVLVMLNDECLGFGEFQKDDVKNMFDIGDFLRRERPIRA